MKNTTISVKKFQSYGILLLALLFCGSVNAKVENYLGAYAQLGDWSLIPTQSSYSTSFGVAGSVGGVYELQAGPALKPTRFLFDLGLGMTGGMTAYSQSSDVRMVLANQKDLQGEPFDYVYEMQDRQDSYNSIALHLPIMFGVQHKYFYMLAGFKFYYHVWTKTRSTALLNTYGEFEAFDEFRNMPEYQFFSNKSIKNGVKTQLGTGFDVDFSFEIGGRIGSVYDAIGFDVPDSKIEYRLAAFLDYGLVDIHKRSNQVALTLPEKYDIDPASPAYVYNGTSMVDNLVMNDIMSTTNFASKVNNLMVGLKFTVLFQMPEHKNCVLCGDSYQSLVRHSPRTRMHYDE